MPFFDKYLLSIYYVPCTMQAPGVEGSSLMKLYLLIEQELENREVQEVRGARSRGPRLTWAEGGGQGRLP